MENISIRQQKWIGKVLWQEGVGDIMTGYTALVARYVPSRCQLERYTLNPLLKNLFQYWQRDHETFLLWNPWKTIVPLISLREGTNVMFFI